ncbi:MAG: S-layer homology domain-containing protein [Bacillota bacterium]
MRVKSRSWRRWITFLLTLTLLIPTALPAVAETGDGTAPAPLMTCLPLNQWAEGVALTSPLAQGDVEYHATSLQVGNIDGAGLPELTWTGQFKIFLPNATSVRLSIVHYGQPVTVAAYDSADNELQRVTAGSQEGTPSVVELSTPGGARKLMLIPGEGRYALNSLCYTTATQVARGESDLYATVDAGDRVAPGESIEVKVSVRNLGNAVAPGTQSAGDSGYRADLVLSSNLQVPVQPGQSSVEFKEDMMLKRLAPTSDVGTGATVEYKTTVQIPASTPPGAYCLGVVLDSYGVLAEANEQNNVSCDGIIVAPKESPDSQEFKWIDFRSEPMGARAEKFTAGMASLYCLGGSKVVDLNADSYHDLLFKGKLEITLPQSSTVSATVTHYGSPVTMEARLGDKVLATKKTTGGNGAVETLTVSAEAIDKVILAIPQGSQASLIKLGYQAPDISGDACDPRVSAIAAGPTHSLAVLKDGTAWAWGANVRGQLGNNGQSNQYIPVQVSGLKGVLAVAAGRDHSLALLNDGTVWAWGSNTLRQIGDGTGVDRFTPVQVTDLSNVVAIAAGKTFSMALKADGTVWAWGDNSFGQIGDGTKDLRSRPTQVKGLTNVKAIAAGANHALAIKADGTLWAWGSNALGQLGDGTTTDRSTPVQIRGITDVYKVAAGLDHTVALRRDRTVWTWGQNNHGQLGDGTTTLRSTPKQVPGLEAIQAVATAEGATLAVRQDGTLISWGYNASHQLGDGTTNDRITPTQVEGLANVLAITSGHGNHVMMVNSQGRLWLWGSNSHGQGAHLFSDPRVEEPTEIDLKQSLLFCPFQLEQQEPVEEPNPAESWACTKAAFSDVPASHPACGAINLLVTAGVVNGYQDGTFRPEDPITRAAMAKLLVAALKLKPNPTGKVTFTDTTGHWAVAQGWLQVAVANNIVTGYPDRTFKPDVEVNRSAAIKMAAGAVNIPRSDGSPIPALRAPYDPPTAHLTDVLPGAWYHDWVVLALRADLIGPEAPFPVFTASRLEPDKVLSRGEAAILVANLLFFREQ